MKPSRAFVLALPLLASLLCVAGAPVPRLVKFSGFVKDAGGNPRTGVTGITFALYKEREGGAALWLETQNVTLDGQGRYTVLLGSTSKEGIPMDAFTSGEARWLGVQPEGRAEHRVLLVSVPYALKAADAETLGGRPASSFVLGAPAAAGDSTSTGQTGTSTNAAGASGPSPASIGGGGTQNTVAKFDSTGTNVINSSISDNGTVVSILEPVGIGTTTPGVFVNTTTGQNALNSTVLLSNTSPITSSIVSAMNLQLEDYSQAANLSKQPLRIAYIRASPAIGGVNTFDSVFTTSSFLHANTPYQLRGMNIEGPNVDPGMTLQTFYGGYFGAPNATGTTGTVTKKFALVTEPGAGNVGIGTITPGSQLEVAGNVKVSGAGNALIFPDGTMRTSATSINGTLSVSGPVQITAPGSGITVRSPDGTRCTQIGIDNTGSLATTVVVPCPLAITTTSLPNATVGTAYDQPIQTSGGDGTAITFALANSTTLPAWASLNPSTGHITGTPADDNIGTSAPFQISATQTGNTVTSWKLTITVVASCAGAPTGHESMLNGRYGFLVQGIAGVTVAIAASFHADGAGHVTGGDFDINETAGATHATINASSYTVGLDPTSSGNLGCVALSLSNGSTTAFRFSLGGLSSGVFSKGRIIEYDDGTGTGTRGSGVLLRQDTTSFALSHLQPRYAYGVDGVDSSGGHFASAGSFTVDTSGNISNAFGDTIGTGETTGGTGTINAISTTTGRATMSLTWRGQTTHQAIYMVNADEFFLIGTDPLSSVPIYSGRAIVTASSFSQSSLSGNYILHTTGRRPGFVYLPCTVLTGGVTYYVPCTEVQLWLVNTNSGALSGTLYFYTTAPGYFVPYPFSGETYAVDATSGRTTMSVGPVFYIATPTATTEPISGFSVGLVSGFVEFQPSATYSTSGMAGNYFYGTEDPADSSVTNEIGVVTISSGGAVTGSEYDSGDGGLATTSPSATLSMGSNGAGSWQFPIGEGCQSTNVAITNGTRLFLIVSDGGYCNGVPVFLPAVVTVLERQ